VDLVTIDLRHPARERLDATHAIDISESLILAQD
jgi:hypothetical protein